MIQNFEPGHITVPVGSVEDIDVPVNLFPPKSIMVKANCENSQSYGQGTKLTQSASTKTHADGTVSHDNAEGRIVNLPRLEMHLDNWTDDSVTFKIDGNTLIENQIVQFLVFRG